MKTKDKNGPQKKNGGWQQYAVLAFSILIGAVCGILIGQYLELSEGPIWVSFAVLFLGIYAAVIVHTILHEAGHWLFGRLSGYQFSSFRIFSFMWLRENDEIHLRRLHIAGTGGQCLMVPPEMVDGKIPVILYNLGGSLMNLIASAVFLGLYFVCGNIPYVSVLLLILVLIGCMLAIMNGVPLRLGTVDNDGYNAFSLTRNAEAMRAFWLQMKINEQVARGVRLKDMPEEWFVVPADEAMKNSMVVVTAINAANRLMDRKMFQEADALMEHLLTIDSGMVGIHRNLMICDRLYYELLTQKRSEVVESFYAKELQKFMKQMKTFPTVLRTEYTYALLYEKDMTKAAKIKAQFEKCAKKYPYPNDVQAERELMEIAETGCYGA